jgi:hypothetical protein
MLQRSQLAKTLQGADLALTTPLACHILRAAESGWF